MSFTRMSLAVVLAAGVTVALGAGSRVSCCAEGERAAVLRLSWRIRGERVDECRHLTEEERAALPVHMRRDEICEGRIAPYRLRMEIDGRSLENSVLRPAGARNDRPIYVYREIRVAPGLHHIVIAFTREGAPAQHTEGVHERLETKEEEERERGGPSQLRFDSRIRFDSRRVVLVTYEGTGENLVLRGSSTLAAPPVR